MTQDPVLLGPNEDVPGRPFTSVAQIERDRSILRAMLSDLTGILSEIDAGVRTLAPYKKLAWKVRGRTHRLLICNEALLRAHPRPCVVGFFGERHAELDSSALEEANTAIVAGFADHPGILSYSSMEMGKGRWANMVLHQDPIDREYWRRNALHADAVKLLSPVHYLNVRIYNAELGDSVSGSPTIRLLRTKYYDYSGSAPWRAERPLTTDN